MLPTLLLCEETAMAKHVGAMYAHITSWSLRETFGEQGSGT